MAISDQFYNELLPDIVDALTAYGTEYTVRSKGAYDADTLTMTEGATRSVKGLVSDNTQERGESNVFTGKKWLLLEPSADPKDNEEINVGGKWYALSKVSTLKPAEVTLLFMLDISR